MSKGIWTAICLTFVLFLTLYFRVFPANFPQLKDKARDIIKQKITDEAIDEINKKFPKYDDIAKDELINKLIYEKNEKNKHTTNELIKKEYIKLKDKYQGLSGQTYLMELDCWHWARYVENVVYLGHPGDKVVNGNQVDKLMSAPTGSVLAFNQFLFYFSAFLYSVFSFIKPVPLFTFLFYLPLFFTAIFIVLLYILCSRRWGNICAVAACVFIGLSPVFINRSYAGWFDMDTLSLFFPLLIVWSYAKNYEAQGIVKQSLWICFSGLCVSLFAATWLNWWFIFAVIILYEAYSLIILGFVYCKYKIGKFGAFRQEFAVLKKYLQVSGLKKILRVFRLRPPVMGGKRRIFSLILFLVFSLTWITVFLGAGPVKSLYSQISGALSLNTTLKEVSIWPNVYFTVEELGKIKFKNLTNMIGDQYLLFFSVFCLAILVLRVLFSRKYTVFASEFLNILIFWFMAMAFACTQGVRFILFLLVPLGIACGVIIQEAFEYLKDEKRKIMVFPAAIVMGLLLGNCFINAYDTARHLYPLLQDSDYEILSAIEKNTPSEAVINSWWDYGDWFKVIARRRVIFDGQSQNEPQAYWMAYVLLNSDEKEILGILRLLNNGGNKAYDLINGYFKDPIKSILFLKKIVSIEPWIAKDVLKKSLPPAAADEMSALFFNKPAKAYFVVDASIKDKIGAISYIGEWDFVKVYIAQNINKKTKDEITRYLLALYVDEKKIERLYNEAKLAPKKNLDSWFTRWLRFKSDFVSGEEKGGVMLFGEGIVYSPKGKQVFIYSNKHKDYRVPLSLFLFENNSLEEITYQDNNLNFSVLIIKKGQNYQAVLLDRKLAASLFTKLFYLDGAGLKNFKPVLEDQSKGGAFRVFEIVWD